MVWFDLVFLTLYVITFSKTDPDLCGGKLFKDPEGQLVEVFNHACRNWP